MIDLHRLQYSKVKVRGPSFRSQRGKQVTKGYSFKNIRILLAAGFSAEEIRNFCFDTPAFRPVHNQLSQGTGKAEIINHLIEYADQKREVEVLLAWAREHNPAVFEEHKPYYGSARPAPGPPPEAADELHISILFLGANPSDTTRLRLDEEVRAIDQAIRQAELREKIEIKQHWAVRVTDLQDCLLRHKPDIVHFSGHGSQSGEIILEDDSGSGFPVSINALSQLFSLLRENIRCVVLNACYSRLQAEAIAEHVDCVVGVSQAIGDLAAIGFAAAFYRALGYGRDVKNAFELGCNEMALEDLGEEDMPVLLAVRRNPEEIVFAPNT
jgi:hypothetical protein